MDSVEILEVYVPARVGEIAGKFRKITEGREEELWLIRIPALRTVI